MNNIKLYTLQENYKRRYYLSVLNQNKIEAHCTWTDISKRPWTWHFQSLSSIYALHVPPSFLPLNQILGYYWDFLEPCFRFASLVAMKCSKIQLLSLDPPNSQAAHRWIRCWRLTDWKYWILALRAA